MASYVFNTFGDVIDEAYDALAMDGDSNTFPGLSRANFNKFANRFNKEFIDSVRMRTQEGTYSFTTVGDTSLSALATSGATSLSITSSTGWPASGLALVDKIPMTFTRSGTTLTVAALTRDFDAGADVQLCYAVPSDFWRPQELYISGHPFGYQRRGDAEGVMASHFALYGDFIALPLATTGAENATLHYYKKATSTLTASDTMDIMEMWDNFIIYKLVAHGHGVLYDDQRKAIWNQDAEIIKRKAKAHFARINGSNSNQFIPNW